MSGVTVPIILTVAAIITAITAYRGMRRGATRFYTLERESMLRRARFTMMGSVLLFLAAITVLVYGEWQEQNPEANTETGTGLTEGTEEPGTVLESQPPTQTPTATVDPNVPTATPTPIVCRAIIDGTAGSGLTLRDAPSGAEVDILPDGSILTLLEEEPVEANTFTWRKVRTASQEEGWVVEDFLKIGTCD